MKRRIAVLSLLVATLMISVGEPVHAQSTYKTENVIIAVMDGAHYERTFGDPTHELIPHLWNDLRPLGTYYSQFFNNGVTITMAGHSTIMTGTWQPMRNAGPLQTRPSIIHYMADELGARAGAAAVIFGKGAYAYQHETSFPAYRGSYTPTFTVGLGEATYQNDHDVLDEVLRAMKQDRPRVVLANFGATDHLAHSGEWEAHIGAVRNCDAVLFKLWNEIQSDPNYRDRTTLIITNDHGYMDDGVHDGFAEHGDASEGSRHIMLLMLGPDVRRNHVVDKPAYQIDIAPTVGELLGFQTPFAQGIVLRDALTKFHRRNQGKVVTDRARRGQELLDTAQKDPIAILADGVLRQYGAAQSRLEPSSEAAFLLWGLLSAHDRTKDGRYLQFVRDQIQPWRASADAAQPYLALVEAQLGFRTKDIGERRELAGRARAVAIRALADAATWTKAPRADATLFASLLLGAAAAELSHDEALWQRVAQAYIEHVHRVDAQDKQQQIHALTAAPKQAPKRQRAASTFEELGKVLPDAVHKPAGKDEAWYLLVSAMIRSHGLPFKGEHLDDVPFFSAEVAYRTFLQVEKLQFPGDTWSDALEAGLSVMAIREMQRRISLGGEFYATVTRLTQEDLNQLRPASAEIMPLADDVKRLLRTRVAVANYNTNYGIEARKASEYMIDQLRFRMSEVQGPLMTGVYLMALDRKPRIALEPIVATPRR